jgi:hypothetical protein
MEDDRVAIFFLSDWTFRRDIHFGSGVGVDSVMSCQRLRDLFYSSLSLFGFDLTNLYCLQ